MAKPGARRRQVWGVPVFESCEGIWASVQQVEDYMGHKERYLMSGYYLATLQAAVELLLTHSPEQSSTD